MRPPGLRRWRERAPPDPTPPRSTDGLLALTHIAMDQRNQLRKQTDSVALHAHEVPSDLTSEPFSVPPQSLQGGLVFGHLRPFAHGGLIDLDVELHAPGAVVRRAWPAWHSASWWPTRHRRSGGPAPGRRATAIPSGKVEVAKHSVVRARRRRDFHHADLG
jgi:hypothetical protein